MVEEEKIIRVINERGFVLKVVRCRRDLVFFSYVWKLSFFLFISSVFISFLLWIRVVRGGIFIFRGVTGYLESYLNFLFWFLFFKIKVLVYYYFFIGGYRVFLGNISFWKKFIINNMFLLLIKIRVFIDFKDVL